MIKKLAVVLGFLVILSMPAMAECSTDACVKPYDLSSGVSRFFSSVSGSNFISQKVAQAIIKKELKKNTNSEMDVKIKSFSTKDLKAGRFKSLKIKGSNVQYGDVYLSSLEATTVCDFNYVAPDPENKDKVIFKEALPMVFRVKMSEDDINKMVKASDYQKTIDELNNLGGNFGLFKVSSTKMQIKNNKFLYILKLKLPFVKGTQDVTVASDLTIKEGKIAFKDTKLINGKFNLDISKLVYVVNYLNPLDYSLSIIDNNDTNLKIENVTIEDNKVVAEGTVTVQKNTVK